MSLIGDYDGMPDLEELAGYVTEEVAALREAAEVGDNGPAPRATTTSEERDDLPYFKDADEVYEFIGKLFEDLADDDELGPKFRKANTIVQYQYSQPGLADHREDDRRRGRPGGPRRDHDGARGGDDDGGRHRPQVLARARST